MYDNEESIIRQNIYNEILKLYSLREKGKKFIPGETLVQYGGAVVNSDEIIGCVEALLDGWFGLGKRARSFESQLSSFLGVKGCILTNSGSSANFLVFDSLLSRFLPNHLNPGDEVITAACGFPTTVNPIVQHNLIPVFVDIDSETYNINVHNLEKALSKKTRAVCLAHTLGNPNNMDFVTKFCRENRLFLIEDNCDALGSKYRNQYTGSFGELATQSFYPPHHITMGEGGAVYYQNEAFEYIIRSLRDWGRSCYCHGDEKGSNGRCGSRFSFKINGVPYDHKYIFNQLGYNLKPIEPQIGIGLAQLEKLPYFIEKRKKNFERLFQYAKRWEEYFILPKAVQYSDPCWFAFPLTIRDNITFTRYEITSYLENRMIQTRPIFAGNITRQPAYENVLCRKIDGLENSDRVMFNSFYVGIYQGLNFEEIDYIACCISDFLKTQ